jgi:hypothetical protein
MAETLRGGADGRRKTASIPMTKKSFPDKNVSFPALPLHGSFLAVRASDLTRMRDHV